MASDIQGSEPAATSARFGGTQGSPRAVLIVEDSALASEICEYLDDAGWEVRSFGAWAYALRALRAAPVDAVVADCPPGRDAGARLIRDVAAIDPSAQVVLLAAENDIPEAVAAMKAGAYEYLAKPVIPRELLSVLERGRREDAERRARSDAARRRIDGRSLEGIIGESPALTILKGRLRRLLESEVDMLEGALPSVLITGETGTGKELVARALHFEGLRRDGPFIELNCASLPVHLLESELFGHERGAFTDAKERKVGLVETAEGGTLFLDEIGEVDLSIQAKLLKLLEERSVRRVGSTCERKVDVRIVSATNRDLEKMVREGRFRADLYFRLRIVSVHMPPLRDRRRDVLLLARHFVAMHGARYGKRGIRLSPEAEGALLAHSWPGNVRELKNSTEQAVLLTRGDVIPADSIAFALRIHPADSTRRSGAEAFPSLASEPLTRARVEDAIRETNWNVARAARVLGITRDTLRYRIRKYGLTIGMRLPPGVPGIEEA